MASLKAGKQLLDAVTKLQKDFDDIEEIINEHVLDAEDILCDDYPFELSFDEQLSKVINWRWSIKEKVEQQEKTLQELKRKYN